MCSIHCSCQSYFSCFPLALANTCPWVVVAFFSIYLKNSELKTTHNTFRDCCVNFFRQPFLEIAVDCAKALHLWKVACKQHTREDTKEREGAGHSRVRARFAFLVPRNVRVESLSRADLYLYIQWISTFVSELLKSLVFDFLTPLCPIQGSSFYKAFMQFSSHSIELLLS